MTLESAFSKLVAAGVPSVELRLDRRADGASPVALPGFSDMSSAIVAAWLSRMRPRRYTVGRDGCADLKIKILSHTLPFALICRRLDNVQMPDDYTKNGREYGPNIRDTPSGFRIDYTGL